MRLGLENILTYPKATGNANSGATFRAQQGIRNSHEQPQLHPAQKSFTRAELTPCKPRKNAQLDGVAVLEHVQAEQQRWSPMRTSIPIRKLVCASRRTGRDLIQHIYLKSQHDVIFRLFLSLQSFASICCSIWRKPSYPRDCCNWRPGNYNLCNQIASSQSCTSKAAKSVQKFLVKTSQLMHLPLQSDGKSTLLEAFLGFRFNVR